MLEITSITLQIRLCETLLSADPLFAAKVTDGVAFAYAHVTSNQTRPGKGIGPVFSVLMILASCPSYGGHSQQGALLLLAEECFVTALRLGGAQEEGDSE